MSSPDTDGLSPALTYGPAVANLLDAITTQQALKVPGARESNPVLEPFVGNKPAFYATKIGTGLLTGFLANKLAKSGHPTWGKILAGLNIALPLGAAAHNAMQQQALTK